MRRMLAALPLMLLVATACSGTPEPVVVGAVYPTGGGQGMGGIEEYRGVELATEYVNADGGVHGRPVELSAHPTDSADGAPGAVREAQAAGAAVVLGSYGSTISATAAAAATDLGVLFWETGAVGLLGEDVAQGERFFRAVSPGESLGEAGISFVQRELLPLMDRPAEDLRWGVTFVDDVYGRSVGEGALAEIEDAGLPLAGAFPYDLADADYDALAAEIAAARTDVLMVSAYLADAIELRRAILAAGVPLVASVGTSSSYCMPAFGEILGTDAVGLFASDKPDGHVLDPDVLAPDAGRALEWAAATYEERWNTEMPAAALSGFSAAWALFHHVMPGAMALEPDALAAATLEADLPLGSLPNGSGLRFAPPGSPDAGSNVLATSVIWEWIEPGTRAVVWPPELATSPVVPLPIA